MIEINFLEQKAQKSTMPSVMGIEVTMIPFKKIAIALVIYYLPDLFLVDYFKGEIKEVEDEANQLSVKLRKITKKTKADSKIKDKLVKFNDQIQKLKERSKQVDQIIQERTNPVLAMEKLARVTPEDLWYQKLEIKEDKSILIEGQSNSYRSIGRFILKANDSPFFGKSLTLAKSKTVENVARRIEEFEIKGSISIFDPYQY